MLTRDTCNDRKKKLYPHCVNIIPALRPKIPHILNLTLPYYFTSSREHFHNTYYNTRLGIREIRAFSQYI